MIDSDLATVHNPQPIKVNRWQAKQLVEITNTYTRATGRKDPLQYLELEHTTDSALGQLLDLSPDL